MSKLEFDGAVYYNRQPKRSYTVRWITFWSVLVCVYATFRVLEALYT